MKRRDFVKSSAATVLGAGLPLRNALAQSRYSKEHLEWLVED